MTVTLGDTAGAGAFRDGGTLVTSGFISGGAGGTGTSGPEAKCDAVLFGSSASRPVINYQAVFDGPVIAYAAVDDVL